MRSSTARLIIALITGMWVALVQPGLSYFWLLDPQVHADIDAEEYGQTPDGRTLPGHPWHPPHDHPSGAALSISDLIQQNAFDARFYAKVFAPADRPSLQDQPIEIAVLATAVDLAPPDLPPRA